MKNRSSLLLALFLAVTVALAVSVKPGLAHGDPSSIAIEEEMGPYHVTVFSSSNVGRQPDLHLSARVNVPQTSMPVMTTRVAFQIAPLHANGHVGQEILIIEAGQADPFNEFMHEANITLPAVGRYLVTAIIQDFSGQIGEVSFEVSVQEVTIWTKIIIIAFLAQAIMALIWIIKEGFIVWTRDLSPDRHR